MLFRIYLFLVICFIVSKTNTNKVNMYVVNIYINILHKRELKIKQKWIYKQININKWMISLSILFLLFKIY